MKRTKFIFFILCIFFVISFITNILGPIMPALIESFHLSLKMAAFLPFSFFLAYGLMSIPAGILIEKLGAKISLFIAFTLTFSGSFLFALFPIYIAALGSLFIIGIGMAMLQVIINPLMRQVGGEEHFAFNAVLAQLVFGVASFASPFIFQYLIHSLGQNQLNDNWVIHLLRTLIPSELPWSSLYWIFTFIIVIMLVALSFIKFPKVELTEEEKVGTFQCYMELFKKKQVMLYFFGIVAYVGTEQGIANWISQFLKTYHGYSPDVQGASAVAWFWGLMSIGCLLGMVILKLVDSKLVLKIFSLLAIITIAIALFGSDRASLYAFPVSGFFLSVMFSVIFSLALNSEEKHHGSFSGILCSGIFGGALIPLVIGWMGDQIGLRLSMTILFLSLGYIFCIPLWAKPLINNKTVKIRTLFATKKHERG